MSNSRTLQNLANSAKASQDEFNNTLIEIHKQSANSIEAELMKIYKDEMNEIKSDTKRQLSVINSEMKKAKETILTEMKPNIIERLWRGTTMAILIIGLLAGFFIGYKIYNNQIANYQAHINTLQERNDYLEKWQIPQNMKESYLDKTTQQEQRVLVINPKEMRQTKDGILFHYLNKAGL
ncbi:hypothetical protein U5B43_09880 [Campylobacter sp. 9BO]|uniref:hypothetical protein n=1 Tax=Campylobacter sp. 9BO TaxID=3424759 RepID=UPI003D34636A